MKRFVAEADRGQWTLLPECLDDFIDESNPGRETGDPQIPDAVYSITSSAQAGGVPDRKRTSTPFSFGARRPSDNNS
jgi:hypothetical protein